MSQSTTMTIRVGTDLKDRLEKLAESTSRSQSFLAAEAIKEFVDLNEWQIQEIQLALTEADKGDFSTEEEVNDVFDRWINAN
jgi:RHH-type rel operon transcriptional repressor/antitoxin RelB